MLTKYESETSTTPNLNIAEGKYAQAFSSLLGPTFQSQNFSQKTSGNLNQKTPENSLPSNNFSAYQEKRESSSNF